MHKKSWYANGGSEKNLAAFTLYSWIIGNMRMGNLPLKNIFVSQSRYQQLQVYGLGHIVHKPVKKAVITSFKAGKTNSVEHS